MSGIGSDAKIAIIMQNEMVKIRDELINLKYPSKEKNKSGNVAIAIFRKSSSFEIAENAISQSFKAYSKISRPEHIGSNNGYVLLNEGHELLIHGMQIHMFDQNEWRENDTERKILGKLYRQIKEQAELLKMDVADFPGELHLYTEKEPCIFCLQAILHFQRICKSVLIYIYYDKVVDKLREIYNRNCQEVINLHEQGKTFEEISSILNMKENEIQSIINNSQ